jgi:AraC-like DNA-binding protein
MIRGQRDNHYNSILSSLSRYYELPDEESGSTAGVMQLKSKSITSVGNRDFIYVREGLCALISDIQHEAQHSESYKSDDVLKLHYRLQGSSGVALGIGDIIESVQPMACGMLLQPAGTQKTEHFAANSKELSITLFCSPGLLEELTADGEVLLPQPIIDMVKRHAFDYFSMGFPMPPDILSASRRLFDIGGAGTLHAIQMQAGCLDLLWKMLRQVAVLTGSGPRSKPRKHDLERVVAVCDLLDKDLSSSPTIPALAKSVGWNETQLTQTFRDVMGMTVYEYRHRAAMDFAISLLTESEVPITQIAYEVGYQYPSNFSTAFKKEFGVTPAAARKRISLDACSN